MLSMHPADVMARNCEVRAGDPNGCPPWEDPNYWENIHLSERLRHILDTVPDSIAYDEDQWFNVRHTEVMNLMSFLSDY